MSINSVIDISLTELSVNRLVRHSSMRLFGFTRASISPKSFDVQINALKAENIRATWILTD